MYLSILRPSRRDMLKMALSHFINETTALVNGPSMLSKEAADNFGVLVTEARQMLREVQASENLMLAHPTTNEQEPM